ncbi:MAG: zinc-dependent alcohol dehydrogenase [Promethearchaeota archaeon]
MKTRGLFLKEPFKLELREVDVEKDLLGTPPRSDMVIVETKACGICGSDISYYKGRNPWSLHTLGINIPHDPNMILGHEISGVIKDVRHATDPKRNGERVGIIAFKECGECIDCIEGRHNLCGHCDHLGHGEILPDGIRNSWKNFNIVPGGFSDYFTCWHEKAIPLPDNISFREATQLDGLAVAVHGANRVGIPTGGAVLILGTGPIGFLSAQVAAAYGAQKVFVTDVFEKPFEQLEKVAKSWKGCELITINAKKEDIVEVVKKHTKGIGADAVMDTIGIRDTVVPGLKSLKRGKRMIMFSGFQEKFEIDLSWFAGERELTGSSNNLFHEYPQAMKLLEQGKINIKEMITHVFKLDDYQEAFEVAYHKEEHNSIKVIIEP